MSPPTSPPAAGPLIIDDEDYDSAEDDDFDPNSAVTAIPDDADSDSDSGSGSGEPSSSRKKRKRRGSDSTVASYGDGSSGEGGLIKTRAQRAKEGFEKPRIGGVLPSSLGVSSITDVDELWRQMNSKPTKTVSPEPITPASATLGKDEQVEAKKEDAKEGEIKTNAEGEETITISRTYTFAGTTHTELKTVPRSSQEARIYLSNISSNFSHSSATVTTPSIDSTHPPRRPPPKKRTSVFDAAAAARKPATLAPAQKLTTLEKSRLDWAGFVDKEGIGEELKKHTRGDKAYLDRQAFLGRVEENRDRAWKEGQKK